LTLKELMNNPPARVTVTPAAGKQERLTFSGVSLCFSNRIEKQ